MQVIKIASVSRNTFYKKVSLDEPQKTVQIHKKIISQFSIKTGMHITYENLEIIISKSEKLKITDVALSFLNYRSRSEKEMEMHLQQKGFKLSMMDWIISKFKKEKLLDDHRFFKELAISRIHNNLSWGDRKIMHDLKAKGLPIEKSESLLMDIYQEDPSLLQEKLRIKKIMEREKKTHLNEKEKIKLKSKFYRMGFDFENIQSVFNDLSLVPL